MSNAQQPARGADRPRYTLRRLPPYSYVPGHAPHPLSDSRGHMAGQAHPPSAALDPDRWNASAAYLYGLDLFNHGYYWEAHEAWEGLWHAAGRRGPTAVWLKALIKLAAAGVKAREGNAAGVARHARRAGELVAECVATVGPQARYCGLSVSGVAAVARGWAGAEAGAFSRPDPHLLLDAWLEAAPIEDVSQNRETPPPTLSPEDGGEGAGGFWERH